MFWGHQERLCTISRPSQTCFLWLQNSDSKEEGSYLPSNRNSPGSERIENAPLAILSSLTPCLFWGHQERLCTISRPSQTCFLWLQNSDSKEEGSYLPSNRNSPESERIENAPLAILISTKQFNSMLFLGSSSLRFYLHTCPPLTDMRPHYSILLNQHLTAKCKFSNLLVLLECCCAFASRSPQTPKENTEKNIWVSQKECLLETEELLT